MHNVMNYRPWALLLPLLSFSIEISRAADDPAAKGREAIAMALTQAEQAIKQGKFAEAVESIDKALAAGAKGYGVHALRGEANFKRGRVEDSIADFDKGIAAEPRFEPHCWMRGISHYYAGRFEDGVKQFTVHQTVNDNDFENAAWRYLCMARTVGVDKARQDLLKIKPDSRVPMMTLYDLYAGKAKPDDVMRAVNAGDPTGEELTVRTFYAHLYLGLYYEAGGDKKMAAEHITTAAEKYKIGHYMWHVARIHSERLKK